MRDSAKTLNEMTPRERANLMTLVADALEATADEAQEIGDDRFAANSISLARIISGCAEDVATMDLLAAELLLQHGISLIALFRREAPPVLH
ncbi:hypothetical protein SM0020_04025 [Sinorhizobium meliloti CCNWSX0020]|uniref:Uncharacterized protein n=2 Tax=Sinorhizobium TaxID=28105 RepID=H0FUG3_RHIML|nr:MULTISPECIES: hypothetical protein [Sinorhizobium]EHK79148.1 hypothetical protein SM0020_04025 [Sinorhizobium meliloti CCNWSX0020]PII38521.1 hypothetical protein T190_19525 [Sinorhizobium meliloti CCBAU 01290]WHS91848.1 hypothetical protein PZL22_000458 [Sinorhizobium kummerowiae]WRW48272.1 hypothetical protein VPK21_001525 [Sinorhizobium kummerowiae]